MNPLQRGPQRVGLQTDFLSWQLESQTDTF